MVRMSHFSLVLCLLLQMSRDVILQGRFVTACNLPMEPGPCDSYFPRFYFDSRRGRCRPFTYGGCHGNGNSFATAKDCEKRCIAKDPSPTARQIHICRSAVDAGPCLGNDQRFFYNSTTGKCEKFVYGGCAGNENRFKSAESCQMLCNGVGSSAGNDQGSSSATRLLPTESSGNSHLGHPLIAKTASVAPGKFLSNTKDCNLPRISGMCRAHYPAFFYNTATGECESFVYGGCRGNTNRFQTKMQCEQKCKLTSGTAVSVCLNPQRVGPCRGRIPRWFYDQASRSCIGFYFGGCRANGNNFASKVACEQKCGYSRQHGYNNNQYRSLMQYYLMQMWGLI